MKKPIHTILLGLLLLPLWTFGQGGVLERYVDEAFAQNLGLGKAQTDLEVQRLKVEEAKGKYLPTVSLNASYLLATGGRGLNFPVGTLFNPVYSTLNQLTGENQFPTDLEDLDIQFTPTDFYDVRLFVSQPLFNPAIYLNHKAQQELISVQEAKIEVAKAELRKNVAVNYYNYLKTFDVLRIYDSTEVMLEEVLRFNRKLVENDKATADVVATVQFELDKLQSDRVNILKNQQVVQAYFNTLLHRPLDSPIEIDPQLKEQAQPLSSLEELQGRAESGRQELAQLQAAIQANQYITTLNRRSMLPSLGLEISGGYQGEGVSFANDQRLGTIALGMNWTLFEGKQRKSRVAQSRLQSRQLQSDLEMVKEQIQVQVIQSWHGFKAAESKLLSERSALVSAEKSFQIVNKRYKNQQALLVEYLDARTRYTNARIALSLAEFDLLISQAELKRAVQL
ncbi:MAG: TolC family protein [Bacteroidota bacterium]